MARRLSKHIRWLRWPRSPMRRAAYLVASAAIILLALELTNTTHIFHKKLVYAGTIPSVAQKPSTPSIAPSSNAKTGPGVSGGNSSSSAATSSAPLVAPYGAFVSNHHPGQNGASNTEESLCNTTPGASCYIKFTQGNVVKALATQTTNGDGSAIWDWDISQAGLSSGSWQVSAVATLGSQTKTTIDPIALEVQ